MQKHKGSEVFIVFNGFIKFMFGTLLGIMVALLLAFNALLLWVATGPRSLNVFSKYIEASFEPDDHNYSILIGETWLIWDGWKHPIDIQLRNVSILGKAGQRFSKFPEISLGLDLFSLFQARLLPTSLTITHPVLSLFQNDDRSISFGFHKEIPAAEETPEHSDVLATAEELSTIPLAVVLAPLLSADTSSNLRKLRLVTIVNADATVGNIHKGVFFKAGNVQVSFKKGRHGMNAFGSAKISYGEYQSLVDAQFAMPEASSVLHGTVNINNLMPGVLANLFTDNPLLNALQFPVSGTAKLSIDTDGAIGNLDFSVDGGKGVIAAEQLENPLQVTSVHAEGHLGNPANEITIKKLTADLDGTQLDADGVVSMKDKDYAVRANAYLKNVPIGNVHQFWPPKLAPETREWVTTNISEGNIKQAESHFNIAYGDLAKPDLPKNAIDSTFELEGATIRYLDEHPPITDVAASIHIDAESMVASIESGRFLKQTKITNGTLVIGNLNIDNPYIKVAFDTESSAKDMVRFLGLPRLKQAKRLNLSEETAEGTLSGHGTVGFHFFAQEDHKKDTEDDITYDIKANVKGMSQPAFMQKFDIKNADGAVTVTNDAITFKGSGEVNGANVSESDVRYIMNDEQMEKGFDTLIDVTATAPISVLPRFGYPAFPFIKGTLGVKASLKEGKNLELSQASIDLTHASMELDVPAAHWSKPDLEPATLELSAQKKNEVVTIPSFALKGKNTDIRGSAELNKELSGVQTVNVEKLLCGGTDLDHVVYEQTPAGFKVDARGKSADVGAWLDSGEDNGFSFEHFPAAEVQLDVAQLIMGKGRVLSGVKGGLSCDAQRCGSANISGTTPDNKLFQFRILKNPNGVRQLTLHAQGAGAFLKAVNVFDGMEGGDLSISGSYDDSLDHSVLTGMVDLNEHTVKNAPILAKMLSLASLTGFFDTLRGNGISFVKLRVPFTLANDVITMKDAKTHGDAMGMTMQGTITFPKRTLDIQGTIVPSYTLNNVLGHVPLVGKMLTGGEGQGVFAARYSIKGSEKEPDVSVNPLSILTPGFLRGLFDVFDAPEKKPEKKAEKE